MQIAESVPDWSYLQKTHITVQSNAKKNVQHLLGPFIATWISPLPAALVSTLKSAVSLILTPLGWRPLPLARQAFGLQATSKLQTDMNAVFDS